MSAFRRFEQEPGLIPTIPTRPCTCSLIYKSETRDSILSDSSNRRPQLDHNKISRGFVNSTNDAAEMIRHELLVYGTAIAVVVDEVAQNYASLQRIRTYIADHLPEGEVQPMQEWEVKPEPGAESLGT